ncbi:MAG TPA: hypothetical protein VFI25_04680 [Planctomycetota bacterium]|jgi:hypothetical protein|nr:hypothetical protein [Planctomycetota bacterium]
MRGAGALGLAWLLAPEPLLAQGPPPDGFRTFESKAKGIVLHLPAPFEELPVPPDEERILLKFTERKTAANEGRDRPEIWIVRLERPRSGEGTDSRPKGPATFPEWVKADLRRWSCRPDGELELAEGKGLPRFRLDREDAKGRGVGIVRDAPDGTILLVGLSEREAFAAWQRTFEKCARSLRAKEAADAEAADVDLHYRLHPFRNVEYRKGVRRNLSRGWKAQDTENFILIYDTKDEALVRKIRNDLEVVRTKYMEVFPPSRPIEAVSTVRVCKDREEFRKFSGVAPNVGGFWNPGTEELVFFDATTDPDAPPIVQKTSYFVLYHEAFHQFIHYSCGEIAPHPWFNEGFGDYFGGCRIPPGGRRVEKLGPNPMRVGDVKRAVGRGEAAPLRNLVRMEQSAYYRNPEVHYAQGWAFVYFLRESRGALEHPLWSRIVAVYFDTLKAKWAEERDRLGERPSEEAVARGEKAARDAAADAAFAGVDFDALEKAWREFVGKLQDPGPK